MAWAPQDKLDAATEAMVELAKSLTSHDKRRLRIKHIASGWDKPKWEAVICGMLSALGDTPDAVLPDSTFMLQREDGWV